MQTIIRAIHCDRALCKSCREDELNKAIDEAGLWMMYPGSEPEPNSIKWDQIDAAMGVKTREVVQGINRYNADYCFSYPGLSVEWITPAEQEAAKRSGAVVTSSGDGLYYIEWEIPECGLFGEYKLGITEIQWEQLRRDTVKYTSERGIPVPKGSDLLRYMKATARHQYSNYDCFLSSRKSLNQPLTGDAVKAARAAYNEEIERINSYLRTGN